MEKANVKVKKWGNSFGVVLPKNIINRGDIKEGSEIEIFIRPINKTKVEDVFGILKGKLTKPVDELMEEVDEELWGIEK